MKSSIALAALVVTTMGLGAIAPAMAQDATPAGTTEVRFMRHMHDMQPMGGMRGPQHGLLGLVCSTEGSSVLETMLDDTAARLKLTADQQKLFDTFRTNALTAQTSFADSCATTRDDRNADTSIDMVDRMKSHLAVETARVTALNALLPDFEALFNSLTDAQKADLFPHDGFRMHMRMDNRGGMDRMHRGPAPGR